MARGDPIRVRLYGAKLKEHGVGEVVYSNDSFGYKPLFICVCGWSSGTGVNETWEEAGAAFDEHLLEEDE